MKAKWLYRIAAILLAILAVGHTYIFLTFKPASADGLAVFEGMRKVHFEFFGGSLTYNMLYRGFGMIVASYLILAMCLAWRLGALAETAPQSIGALRCVLAGVQIAVFILAWIFLAGPPVWLTAIIMICVAWAAWA